MRGRNITLKFWPGTACAPFSASSLDTYSRQFSPALRLQVILFVTLVNKIMNQEEEGVSLMSAANYLDTYGVVYDLHSIFFNLNK